MKIIDIHTHAWTDAVAPNAIPALQSLGALTAFYDGTVAGLRGSMERCGVSASVIQPVATKASQVRGINDWAATIGGERSHCASARCTPRSRTLRPRSSEWPSSGLRGVKLHPEHQAFAPDEARLGPIYEAAVAYDMTVFFHAGADELHQTVRGTPQSFSAVLEAFPQMRVVLAHLGGFRVWNDVAEVLVGPRRLARHRVHARPPGGRRLRRNRSCARCREVLFGSDGPWTDAAAEIAWLRSLAAGRRRHRSGARRKCGAPSRRVARGAGDTMQ